MLWWEIFVTDSWMLLIDHVKNIERRKHLSDQEHRCGASRRPSGVWI